MSARASAPDRVLITPRRALGLVTEAELVELDLDGRQVAGEGEPPLEVPMHLAVYRRRPDVMAIARGHPRNVAAYACAGASLKVAHGFGANLGAEVPVFREPYLITAGEMADGVAIGARRRRGGDPARQRHARGRAVGAARLRAGAVPGGDGASCNCARRPPA